MLTGVGLNDLADLDERQLQAITEAAKQEQQRRSWTQETELIATLVDEVRALRAQIAAGVQVALIKRPGRPQKVSPVDRPAWLRNQGSSPAAAGRVVTPAELFGMFRR